MAINEQIREQQAVPDIYQEEDGGSLREREGNAACSAQASTSTEAASKDEGMGT